MKTLSDFDFGGRITSGVTATLRGITVTLIDPQAYRLFKIKSGKKHYFNLDKRTGKQSHTTKENKAYIYHREDYYMLYLCLMEEFEHYIRQEVV